MKLSKPLIKRFWRGHWEGWVCMSPGYLGAGETIQEAYQSWLDIITFWRKHSNGY